MRHLAVVVLGGLLGACSTPQTTPSSPKPPQPEATDADEAAADDEGGPDDEAEPAPEMTITGVLDEASFAKLHTLTGEDAPPPRGEEIQVGGARAYLSLPEGAAAPLPAVLVIHEWWGLNEHIEHWTDRLAADGYAALAVDLYGGQVATDRETALQLMKGTDAEAAAKVLSAAHEFLAADERIKATKRGVIGWCFGGGWSLQHALATEDLDAAVVYYGQLVTDPKALAPLKAPVMGVFGNADTGIPPASVDAFEAAMKKAGKSLELHRYDDAPHAFANPSSGRYVPAAAEDAWAHARSFLAEHLDKPDSVAAP